MHGNVILDVKASELPAVRARVPAGYTIHDDGRASYELPTTLREIARVAQAVGVAACVSAGGSFAFEWPVQVALPVGFVVGLGFAAWSITLDRARLHRAARALLRATCASARSS
jgi:hypothetical protein